MSVKRLPCTYEKPGLPEIDFEKKPYRHYNTPMSADFLPYATSHDQDIALTNGSIEFLTHKEILCLLSAHFKSILEDEPNAKTICIRDVADETMHWLQEFIYCARNRHSMQWKQSPRDEDLLLLATKYEMKLVLVYAEGHFSKMCVSYRNQEALKSLMKTVETSGLNDLKEIIEKASSTFAYELSFEELMTFEESRVAQIVEHPSFEATLFSYSNQGKKSKMFGMLMRYAREKKSKRIFRALKDLIPDLEEKRKYETLDVTKIQRFLKWIEEMLEEEISA